MNEEADFYGQRLAAANKKTPVITTEDIFNTEGALVLSKGSAFSKSLADQIAQHKLIKPLEHSVNVANSLDADGLYQKLLKFSSSLRGLHAVVDNDLAKAVLYELCHYYQEFPLIRQKLSVLASQLPEIYFDSLYSCMAGIVIAIEMGLEEEDMQAIFIGGLMHNIGYLHLNPELTKNPLELERLETQEAQAHPIIAKHFLERVPGIPKHICSAVADHHERTDGTGYPNNKFGTDLTIASQIIAFTDKIISAYRKCMVHDEHAHQLMMMILQFNNNVHFEAVYNAATKLIKKGPMPDTPPKNPPSVAETIEQLDKINTIFDASKKLALVLMKNTRTRLTKSIASMLGRLANAIVSSGIMQAEYREWLENLAQEDNPEEHLLLLKSKVMQDEIEDQLERLKSIMWKTICTIPENESALLESVISSHNQISSI